jgi:hypothetical protein
MAEGWAMVDLVEWDLVMPLSVIQVGSEASRAAVPLGSAVIGLPLGIDQISGDRSSAAGLPSSVARSFTAMMIVTPGFGPDGAGAGYRPATKRG